MSERRIRPHPRLLQVAVLALAGAAAAVHAASAPGIESCAGIADDRARLACYDRLSGRTASEQAFAGDRPEKAPRQPMTAPAPAAAGAERADAGASTSGGSTSLLEQAWSFAPGTDRYLIKLHRPNYVAPVRYQNRTNNRPFSPLFSTLESANDEVDNLEAAFQISFKTRLWATENRRLGFWFAYTQQSFWQVYNGDNSSPFRDTNYEPELLVSWRPGLSWGGFDWNLLNVGYNHQSNGRADPISRSWDRLVAEIGIEKHDFALLLRPWIRIDDESDDDDNPDITDFFGYGDITAVYKWRGHSFALMARGNPAEEKGAVRATWMTPRILGPLRGYLIGFSGYGDTLLDYNFKQNTISAGIALNDLLDR